MYYTIYETVNMINGKKYLGKHATSDINDNYLGSGILLSRAILKYGRENFIRRILFTFDNKEDMDEKERELIDLNVVVNPEYYNIALGGYGGNIILNEAHPRYKEVCSSISKAQQARKAEMSTIAKMQHKLKRVGMYGKKQTDKQKNAVSEVMRGRVRSDEEIQKLKNSQRETYDDPNYIHPNKGVSKIRLTCPHCSKVIGGQSNYNRHHGDNCKFRI